MQDRQIQSEHALILDGGVNVIAGSLMHITIHDVTRLETRLGAGNEQAALQQRLQSEFSRMFSAVHLEAISSVRFDDAAFAARTTLPEQQQPVSSFPQSQPQSQSKGCAPDRKDPTGARTRAAPSSTVGQDQGPGSFRTAAVTGSGASGVGLGMAAGLRSENAEEVQLAAAGAADAVVSTAAAASAAQAAGGELAERTRTRICAAVLVIMQELAAEWGVTVHSLQLQRVSLADKKDSDQWEGATLGIAMGKAKLQTNTLANMVMLQQAAAEANVQRLHARGAKDATVLRAEGNAASIEIEALAHNSAATTMSHPFAQSYAVLQERTRTAAALHASTLILGDAASRSILPTLTLPPTTSPNASTCIPAHPDAPNTSTSSSTSSNPMSSASNLIILEPK